MHCIVGLSRGGSVLFLDGPIRRKIVKELRHIYNVQYRLALQRLALSYLLDYLIFHFV